MEFNTETATPDDSSTPSPLTETIERSHHSSGIGEMQAVSLTFVNDLDVPEVQLHLQQKSVASYPFLSVK